MNEGQLIVFCDGGSRGNPGPAAAAFVILEEAKVVAKGSKYLGKTTNNVAEYEAVLLALKWIQDKGYKGIEIKFVLDSQLATKQLSGQYKIKSENLKPLVLKVKTFERSLKSKVTYTWSPRSKNKTADTLVNEELDKNV